MKIKLLIFAVLIVFAASLATAKSSYLSALLSTYNIPTNSKLNDCSTCHSGQWARNVYGAQLESAGAASDIAAAFAATDELDADDDGAKNWVELVNGTWPADPSDTVPVDQSSWGRIKALFN